MNEVITFSNCNEEGWSNSYFDFGDGNGNESNPDVLTYSYSAPGTYYVYHLGQDDIADSASRIGPLKIVVLPLLPPKFEVKTCLEAPVTLTINDTIYNQFEIDWENDGNYDATVAQGAVVNRNYPAPGDYTINVRGVLPGCSEVNQEIVTVFESVEKPVITSLNSEPENQISLTLTNLKTYLNYTIEIKKEGQDFQKVLDLQKENGVYTTDYTFEQVGEELLNTTANTYCIRVIVSDQCGKQEIVQLCTIQLNAEALFDENDLFWESSQEQVFEEFSVHENTLLDQSGLSGNTRSYKDNLIQCNRNYCYQIVGIAGGSEVRSNIICVTGKSDDIPSTIKNLTVTVNNNSVDIYWEKPTGMSVKEYILSYFSENGTQMVYTGIDSSYTDNAVNPASTPACYKISYVDSCDNKAAESPEACTILLKVEQAEQNHNKLNWTNYIGWEMGVKEYVLEILDASDNVIREVSMGNNTSFEDMDEQQYQVIRYRIRAIPMENIPVVSFSNIFEIKQNFVIALPNAFTPNGDGRNESFEMKGRYISNVKMQIYNKWGELIFQGESWDGMSKGGRAASGTYVYYLEAEDETGEKIIKKGTVTLIR